MHNNTRIIEKENRQNALKCLRYIEKSGIIVLAINVSAYNKGGLSSEKGMETKKD